MKTSFKIAMIALALIFVGTKITAQEKPLTFGVKGGMNVSNFSGDFKGTDAKIGFNVGLTADYAFTENIYLLTGIELSTKGAKLSTPDLSGILGDYDVDFGYDSGFDDIVDLMSGSKITMNLMYIKVPIHLGYKIDVADNTRIVLNAGPYMAYGVGGKTTVELKKIGKVKDNSFGSGSFKRFDMGLGLGAGVEFGKICANLGYDFGLLNIADSDGLIKVRNGNFNVGIGYKF